MTYRTKIVTALVALCLVDIVIPIPILGLALIWVVLERPAWFPKMARAVYGASETPS